MNANILACAALGLALASTGAPAMAAHVTVNLTKADDGKTIALAKKNCLNIHLDTQPSTGYGWSAAMGSTPLLKLKSAEIVKPAAMPGAVQKQELIFCAIHAGEGTLKLDYRRVWEKNVPPAKSFTVSVTIKR